jgi:hypothetical protein
MRRESILLEEAAAALPQPCIIVRQSFHETQSPQRKIPPRGEKGQATAPYGRLGDATMRLAEWIGRRMAFAWSGQPLYPCRASAERSSTSVGKALG